MQELIISLVLAVHLLAMNLACGGPLLCIGLDKRQKKSAASQGLGQSLAKLSLWAYLFGMLSGGALLLLPDSENLRTAMGRLPERAYWFAGAELLFSGLCLWAFAYLWPTLQRWRWAQWLIALVATTNLFYHFPPLMIVLGKLAENPSWSTAAVIDRQTFLQLMFRLEVLSLSIHFGLASLAVGAMAVIVLVARRAKQGLQEAERRSCRGAAITVLLATALQLPVGIWVLTAISDSARGALVGESVMASIMFLGSLLTTMYLLQGLVKIVLGDFGHQDCSRVVWLMVFVVLLMTASLRLSRQHRSSIINTANENSLGENPPRLQVFGNV